jgi:hypothetical protein
MRRSNGDRWSHPSIAEKMTARMTQGTAPDPPAPGQDAPGRIPGVRRRPVGRHRAGRTHVGERIAAARRGRAGGQAAQRLVGVRPGPPRSPGPRRRRTSPAAGRPSPAPTMGCRGRCSCSCRRWSVRRGRRRCRSSTRPGSGCRRCRSRTRWWSCRCPTTPAGPPKPSMPTVMAVTDRGPRGRLGGPWLKPKAKSSPQINHLERTLPFA